MVLAHDEDVIGGEQLKLPVVGLKLQGRRVKGDVDVARGEEPRKVVGERNAGEMQARRGPVEVLKTRH